MNGSLVEEIWLRKSGQPLKIGPNEKIGVIIVDNFPALGKLTALRFLEWVQKNPGGVISLPTGKTPEYFIKWVTHYLRTWWSPNTQSDLADNGLDPSNFQDMASLHFVQIDEFYPISPLQHNSFYYYVNKFYISGFGLDPEKALLIDCSKIGLKQGQKLEEVWPENTVDISLRYRSPRSNLESLQKDVLHDIDQWCYDYEQKIRSLGGIGFFLGGIGPDGHIAFNVLGSDHNSTTRLTETNYETQAAAATDLGGIEVSRRRLVITIGLSTITYNPECTALIIAAGESKAQVVSDAITSEPSVKYPATALQKLPNARFYITKGAGKLLEERQLLVISSMEKLPNEMVEKIVIDLALKLKKRISELTKEDFANDKFASRLVHEYESIKADIERSLKEKVELGKTIRSNTTFLHTAPHHDDIMLGYLPYAVRHIRDASNAHIFACMTSGFTSVTNKYALSLLIKLRELLKNSEFRRLVEEGYFGPGSVKGIDRDVWQYLDGVASGDQSMKDEGEARRMLRNLVWIFEDENIDNLENRIEELINYFSTQYPGKKDLPYIQQFKGMIREWEEDCLWGYLGFNSASIRHMRLGFYKGDIFTEEPEIPRDVRPVFQLLNEVNPDVVTVALDPEGSGPDTHYKVLQIIAEALRQYEQATGRSDIEILGYRNVWHRFHPSEANIYVPVSLNMFAVMQNAFMNAYGSQRDASFPSYEYDGPFSVLAQKIQVRQYQMIKICLGREFFNDNPSPLIRATRGFVFLKKMSLQEFYKHARELRRSTEDL